VPFILEEAVGVEEEREEDAKGKARSVPMLLLLFTFV